MQHVVDFIAALVVALSAAALAHFGVTLRDGPSCPHARAHAIPVVQRLPAERRPARARIVLTPA